MDNTRLLGDRYRLDKRVDGGGMGDVWRGKDIRLDRTVAIKVLHAGLSGDPTFRERFHAEARAVAALSAPGVVNLFDYGEDSSFDQGVVSYLVMEYVSGTSLRTILSERGSLGVDQALDVVAQAGDALDIAHRAGIIHRDVKPGNILIDEDTGQVKLVDFGIARTRGQSSLTETGVVMGSVSYVAPEQLYGQDPSNVSDVYSLGVVAYEALAGRKPFEGDVPATIISEQLHTVPPDLPDDVPPGVREVVMRALAKQPEERWASGAQFAAACRSQQGSSAATTVISKEDTVAVAADAIPTASIDRPDAIPTASIDRPDPLTVRAPAHESADSPEDGPAKSDKAATSHRRSRLKLRSFVITAAAAALLAAGGIAAATGWDDEKTAPQTQASSSESHTESDSPQHPSITDPPTAEDTTGSQSETSTSSKAPSSSSSSSKEPEKGTIPGLIGQSEAAAIATLEARGFTEVSSYEVGTGEYACKVVEQDPSAGTSHELDKQVRLGIEYGDTPNCESTESSTPD